MTKTLLFRRCIVFRGTGKMESWYLASLQRTEVYLLYLEPNFVGCEVWCHRTWVTKPSAMTWITQRSLSARRYHRNVMRCMMHDATVALRKGLSWGEWLGTRNIHTGVAAEGVLA